MSTKRCTTTLLILAALGATTIAKAAEPTVPKGLEVYNKVCVACHQADGKGMAGLAPALAGTLAPAVKTDDGRRYIAGVLIHGLSGRIVSQGQTFVGAMPGQATLSDAELTDVANHVARDLNGATDPVFTAADFVSARAAKTTHKELRDLREKVLK